LKADVADEDLGLARPDMPSKAKFGPFAPVPANLRAKLSWERRFLSLIGCFVAIRGQPEHLVQTQAFATKPILARTALAGLNGNQWLI
jgi:hypothetical protein